MGELMALPVKRNVLLIRFYSGILNQEAQVIDAEGMIHVLNRENTTGFEQCTDSFWTRTALPLPAALPSTNNITGTPTVIGKRGKLVAPPLGLQSSTGATLLAILPSNAANSSALSIIGSTAAGHFVDWRVLWEASDGCNAEPLFDRYRLAEDGVLSIFVVNGTEVGVVDFEL
ncbi:hypothetical protein EIP86_007085 [Pleurotus ostreatoroseus]|nr:hypothetical protein EIP86_007085 [Pleurotus ostreatoroseus]